MIRRTFLAMTAATAFAMPAFADSHLKDIVDTAEGMKAATVNGAEVTVTLDGGPKVNGAVISGPDVEASNGVIHVIDSVIMPPM